MMRLNKPLYDFEKTLTACCAGISVSRSLDFYTRVNDAKEELETEVERYLASGEVGELYIIPSITRGESDPIVVGTLKRSELVKLYEQYLVSSTKGRIIYDAILMAANEKCPFCGGIGRPRTLDHYLPKTNFPQFSILPQNLIPACRDCNLDSKGQNFAKNAQDQIIHPYFDGVHFFEEQWVFATYSPSEIGPGVVEYFVRSPDDWLDKDKRRVEKHFNDFQLAARYSIQAASELPYIENEWRQAFSGSESDSFIVDCQRVVNRSPFINQWKRVMYQALINAI